MRIFAATCGASISAIRSIRSPHRGQARTSRSQVRRISVAQSKRRCLLGSSGPSGSRRDGAGTPAEERFRRELGTLFGKTITHAANARSASAHALDRMPSLFVGNSRAVDSAIDGVQSTISPQK